MGVGAVNPNFLNPEGALLWLGALLDAHPECAHIHRLGFGRVCRGPFANSGSRQLDELLGEALGLEGMGVTAWWARPSALISRPGIGDETLSPLSGSVTWGRLVDALSRT